MKHLPEFGNLIAVFRATNNKRSYRICRLASATLPLHAQLRLALVCGTSKAVLHDESTTGPHSLATDIKLGFGLQPSDR